MDRTPKYIEMSKAAIEVQEYFGNGEMRFDYRSQGYCTQHNCLIIEGCEGEEVCPVFMEKFFSLGRILTKKEKEQFGFGSPEDCEWNKKWIGLPYQDQLQKMITNKGYFRFSLIELFYRFTRNVKNFTSMEQFWLAFVMKLKYKKIWSNEKGDWIKEIEK